MDDPFEKPTDRRVPGGHSVLDHRESYPIPNHYSSSNVNEKERDRYDQLPMSLSTYYP